MFPTFTAAAPIVRPGIAVFIDDELENELSGLIFFGRAKLFLGDLYKIVRGRQPLFTQEGLKQKR